MGIFDNRLRFVGQWGARLKGQRPPLEKYYGFFIAALIGWMLADLILLSYRPSMLPSEAPPIQQERPRIQKMAMLQDYNSIMDRNIFSEDGKIPPALSADKNGNGGDESAPVQSQLPIQLLGTIVHFNPKMSIATVTINSSNQTMSYSVDENMGDIAELKKIERKRIVFMNTNLRRLEFIEIPDDAAFNFAVGAPVLGGNDLVQKEGQNDFTIKRADLEGLTGNLSSLLQQARMEPRIGPDGQPDGFCFTNIQPGTPYEKFGFKIGDCIKNVNGEAINSPGKAMELYQLLRQASFVQLGIERDGRDEKFNYSIK